MDKVRFGVIGAGLMGRMHAEVGFHYPGAEFVAAADPDEERANQVARMFNGKAYADYVEMMDKEKLDAVIIATPETLHVDPVEQAANRGLHILLEKPMARNLGEADAILKARDDNKIKLMIAYLLRFETTYAKMKEAVDSGTFGRFLSAYGRRNGNKPEARRLAGRTTVVNYIAVHDIDQILWYHPKKVVKVFSKCIKADVQEELGTPDFYWTMFEFEDGALGITETGWGYPDEWTGWKSPASWGGFGDAYMNVIGTKGVGNLNLVPMGLYACDGEGWKMPDTRHWPSIHGRIQGALRLEGEHFYESLLKDKEPMITGEDGRRSLEVACAAEKSIQEGREITLPL
jgi:UDP-N-acetylglucosamine 3-dehydrogenase